MIEPQATVLSAKGIGTRFMNTEEFYPHDEITLVFYGEKFAAGQPATAEKFLKAYLRGARDYSDAIKAGRLAGPGAAGVIKIMAENFHLDADLIAQMYAPAVDPDGAVNLASLQKDLDFFRDQKMMTEPIDLAKVVDLSFAKKASAALGPYRAKGR
jgi:NitT/TauT family transport system substrate-binding protein